MGEHDDYADHELPPNRVPSLWMLFQVLVLVAALGGTIFFFTYFPPPYVE